MEIEHYFFVLIGIVTTYIIIGNYVYLTKVLPRINESASGMPSQQFKHIAKFVVMLDENNEKPWFYYLLKHSKTISAVIFVLMLTFLIMFWGKS